MLRAIDGVTKKEMGWLNAAKTSVLHELPCDEEQRTRHKFWGLCRDWVVTKLIRHIQLLETRIFGLTCNEGRKLAFQLAEKNSIVHRFISEDEMAGWD
ncbi:hypothetical protein PR048_021475 [Dryococelus australis]|uniref:Uncharacterized protein n=1 Tax=Dryococelus australis TaxID=614101 RepID=A0ABQ9GYC5_9NEOP|nr:hypothetical protein PR048_021475 [Dryococelus australis]